MIRRKPLRSNSGLKRTEVKRTPKPKRYDTEKEAGRRAWARTAQLALQRDGYRCQGPDHGLLVVDCHGRLDPHHRLPRARGGADELDNLVTLCRFHHDYVHGHPLEASKVGLLRDTPPR